jgi:hypothetical protein
MKINDSPAMRYFESIVVLNRGDAIDGLDRGAVFATSDVVGTGLSPALPSSL